MAALALAPTRTALQEKDAAHGEFIREQQRLLGTRMVLLTHHYQREEIVALGDFVGDSYGLSKRAAEQADAEYIVFCGVRFMVESARVLARPDQVVIHPDRKAGCPMADMATIPTVIQAWDELEAVLGPDQMTPVTYMNSDVDLKAFCGAHGGIVCTSSNATAVYDWAFAQRPRIFFFPDEHLGRNTGNRWGIPRDEMVVWDPLLERGGNTVEQLQRGKVILWKGYCHVHTHFTVQHIEAMRQRYPGIQVIVHPECTEEVVAAAAANGSTDFMVRTVRSAPAGSQIAMGTEINLISRLAHENPDKTVMSLSRSLCPNMWKIGLDDVAHALEHLGEVNVVHVDPVIAADARLALDRMLSVH